MNVYELIVLVALILGSGLTGTFVGIMMERTKAQTEDDHHPVRTYHNVMVDFAVGHTIKYNLDIDGDQHAFGQARSTSVIDAVLNFHESTYGEVDRELFRELDIWNEPSLPIHIEVGDVSYRVDFFAQTYGNKTYEWENIISG